MKNLCWAFTLTIFAFFPAYALAGNDPSKIDSDYRLVANRIIDAAIQDKGAWEKLVYLCDRIGHRFSGTPQLEEAIQWAAVQLENDGLENIRTPNVSVPRWFRGKETATIIFPVKKSLHLLGLGGSIGTPKSGIKAEIAVVESFDELKQLGKDNIQGKIVVYNVEYRGYGRTVPYRTNGAIEAARLGAVGVLVRSVTPVSLQSPHTGAMRYDDLVPRIPAAAISVEDSLLLDRLAKSGDKVVVEIMMEARNLPDSNSANVIAEIRGYEKPEEFVVIGGHIDSWDVGQGAHDDGVGTVVSMQVGALLRQLDLRPRRSIRIVLWTNEEFGLSGARAYRDWIGEEINQHVAAIEMDGGAEKPIGFGLGLSKSLDETHQKDTLAVASAIGRLLSPVGADQITLGGGGADISPLMAEGVPGFGLRTVGTHYFDWHHSEADTVDKVNIEDLRKCLAAMTVLAYVLADMPGNLVDPQN
jgi:carboxypeptidase Q